MAKEKISERQDRVIIFGSAGPDDLGGVCEILDVEEIKEGRVCTFKASLPVSDAKIYNSDQGVVYAYNCNLPYLSEVNHLGEVEKNIIVAQAFQYHGRVDPPGKVSGFVWAVVGLLTLLTIIGMIS